MSSSDAPQHSAMTLQQRSRPDSEHLPPSLKPLCIAYARAAAKLASTAVATDRSLSGSAHVSLLPPTTEDHAPDGVTVDMYDVAEPTDRHLVDLLNVIRNLTALGRKLDANSQHTPSLACRSDGDHELSAPSLHSARLTHAEILSTRAELEAQREVLESIQRTMSGGLPSKSLPPNDPSHHAISHCNNSLSDAGRGASRAGRACPLTIGDTSSPPSNPSHQEGVGDASSEAAPSSEAGQQLDAVLRREKQWKMAAEAAVVAARAMKEAAYVTRTGATAEIASWRQQAETAMRQLIRAETASDVEKVEAVEKEDLLARVAELELENTR
jgi:hypothetical protein